MAAKATKKNLEFDSEKNYKFELTTPHQGMYILPKEAIVYCETKKALREIRLSPTSESPYKDEQKDSDELSSDILQFVKGSMSVSGIETYKLNYLLALDNNVDKTKRNPKFQGSFLFKLIDEVEIFENKAKNKKLEIQIASKLADASKEDLANFLLAEYNYTPKTDSLDELFTVALQKAQANPSLVLKTFNTEENKLKSALIDSFKQGVLKNTKGVITWAETGTEIQTFKVEEGDKLTDLMVAWVAKGGKEATDFVKKLALTK